jgi:peptide/nickel transport system substrate-binding protein
VTLAHATPVLSLDPTLSEGTTSSALSNVFEPLVAYDALLQITPVLATSWETPDETTWDFELRPGVTFHDGAPLDATAVVAALENARRRSDSTVRGALRAVSRLEVRGPHALRMRTSVPDALLLHELTLVLVGRATTRAEAEATPVGTGPYRVAAWSRGGPLQLVAWPGHWAGPPLAPSVRVVSLPSGTDPTDAVARGEADVAEILTAPPRPSPPAGVRLVTSPGLTTHYLWMNGPATVGGAPNPFHDVRVRRAVALAIDRRLLAREATGSEENAATRLVPPTIVGHSASLPAPRHDPEAARSLLVAAGVRLPLAVTLAHRSDAHAERVARRVVAMLDGVGFRVTLLPMPWDDLLVRSREGRIAFFLGGWAFDAADAAGFLRDCVRSRTADGAGGVFNPGYANPEVDRIVDASPSVFIASTRVAMLADAIRIATDEAPLVSLYNQPDAWAVSSRVRWSPRLDGRLLARDIRFPEGGR